MARFFRLGAIMDLGELIFGIFLVAGTYVGSAIFAIILFRLFFPLKTKVLSFDDLYLSSIEKKGRSSTKNSVSVFPRVVERVGNG
jgi:hypothetical protein